MVNVINWSKIIKVFVAIQTAIIKFNSTHSCKSKTENKTVYPAYFGQVIFKNSIHQNYILSSYLKIKLLYKLREVKI